MRGFIEWLEGLNDRDTRVRAVLRRSLAFDTGTYIQSFPYIEPFVKNEGSSWLREMHYLVLHRSVKNRPLSSVQTALQYNAWD